MVQYAVYKYAAAVAEGSSVYESLSDFGAKSDILNMSATIYCIWIAHPFL